MASRRRGKFVLYRLADDVVLAMLAAMRKVAERNVGEVERMLRSYFHERDELEPVARAELQRRMKQGPGLQGAQVGGWAAGVEGGGIAGRDERNGLAPLDYLSRRVRALALGQS